MALPIPDFNHTVLYGNNISIVTDNGILHIPRADGDEAMQYILDRLDIGHECNKDLSLLVLDVGGLFGDFGLSTAKRGCPTIMFEPQLHHAQQIARSIILNQVPAWIHNAAVSPLQIFELSGEEGTATMADPSKKGLLIPIEQLDKVVKSQQIVEFLKVDVEGFEDQVLSTATNLFHTHRVHHAVFEYTPKQFHGRRTDYKSFIPRLFNSSATGCFVLHRKSRKIYRLSMSVLREFYDQMYARSLQTDVYCSFVETKQFQNEDAWTPDSKLY
mmetsp:Transcript_7541/g.21011  ORF Transcript_7541/g.21011 Transcript_7541/m.21011 type:complete len:272 (-) Transcript_7541:1245-2060(-)